jgi:hypothetical protein
MKSLDRFRALVMVTLTHSLPAASGQVGFPGIGSRGKRAANDVAALSPQVIWDIRVI